MTVRVLLADDHPVYRKGLAGVLAEADDIDIVGEAVDGADVLVQAVELRPDVVVMDLHMPTVNGVEATRRLAVEAPGVSVLVLTMFDDDESVHAAMRAGARGYLVKGAAGEAHPRSRAGGGSGRGGLRRRRRAPGCSARSPRTGAEAAPGPFPGLDGPGAEILDLIAAGRSNTEIARRLVLSRQDRSGTWCRTSS